MLILQVKHYHVQKFKKVFPAFVKSHFYVPKDLVDPGPDISFLNEKKLLVKRYFQLEVLFEILIYLF